MKASRIFAVLAGVLLVAGGIGVALWPEEPPPEPELDEPDGDSGMTEEQRIRMMEEIGYIQQED
ncbi:MAG: hypothetical protein H6740_29090 [Alphaproteobacteria bacterium]|nr:hypothetical protein [Alphaproteobacteria bacterium]